MNFQTILRLRPLEPKHKLKEDYFKLQQKVSSDTTEESKYYNMIKIHDPLKRSKDQYEYLFDKVYPQDARNMQVFKESIVPLVEKAVSEGECAIILDIGHKDSGKSYTLLGDGNYSQMRNVTESVEYVDDSRGLILRSLCEIFKLDPQAEVHISFIDQVLDNIRDLTKYVLREKKVSGIGIAQEMFQVSSLGGASTFQSRANSSYDYAMAQQIEREFIELHEMNSNGDTVLYMKNVIKEPIRILQDAAYIIDKGKEMSETLNKRLNYTVGIRQNQIFIVTIKSSYGRESTLTFIDTADYDKLQTNVIDSQKLYEQIVLNNTFNSLAQIIGGLNREEFYLFDAPYDNSKLTRILQSILQQTNPETVNFVLFACIWPCEIKYQEVLNTLNFVDRFKLKSQVMTKSEYYGEMSTNQEKIMQDISKENVDIKFKIDAFKREHMIKLTELKNKIGLPVPIDSILKTKGNQKELQIIKDHKEAIEKTENYSKLNKEIEKKLESIQKAIEDDVMAKREIQEQFSQKYYILQKKIFKLREEYKQCEMELDNTMRGQINDRNEELQKVLNNTHAMLIENSELVEQLNDEVIKKANPQQLQSKRINFMKDEGKKEAEVNYTKLFSSQEKEWEHSLNSTKETYENLLKKREEELKKATEDFKKFHERIKEDEHNARSEIIKMYSIVKKQNQVLTNVENGVYSQSSKKLKFNEQQKPDLPEEYHYKFLFKTLEKGAQRGDKIAINILEGGNGTGTRNTTSHQYNSYSQQQNQHNKINLQDQNPPVIIQSQINIQKDVDVMTNPEELRQYAKQLLQELNRHSVSHPQVLKGEKFDSLMSEIDKNKKQYEMTSKKNNDIRIQIEAQRRLIERAQLEKAAAQQQALYYSVNKQ